MSSRIHSLKMRKVSMLWCLYSRPFLIFCLISIGIRLLFLSSTGYFSTDFEVHRNWLAITYSIPFSQWYKENTSIWTLDYPPFFAFFEFIISLFAKKFDPEIVNVQNLNYSTRSVIEFQRYSVIVADLLILLPAIFCLTVKIFQISPKNGTQELSDVSQSKQILYDQKIIITSSLISLNFGLLLVDHIHFQYNGYLLGLLFFSLSFALDENYFISVLFFSILLYSKHIFIYMTLPMILYLLYSYCLPADFYLKNERVKWKYYFWSHLSYLAFGFIGVSIIAILPIYLTNQFQALIQRLFPFGRGLVHSYWAPNVWTLYLTLDRILTKLLPTKLLGHMILGNASFHQSSIESAKKAIMVLPNISPKFCLSALILFGYVPLICYLSHRLAKKCPHSIKQIELPIYLSLGNYVGFFMGWHVHEKAILYSTTLLIIPVMSSASHQSKIYLFWLNIWTYFSLCPLLSQTDQFIFKSIMFFTFSTLEYKILCCSRDLETSITFMKRLSQNKRCVAQISLILFLSIYQNFWSNINFLIFGKPDFLEFLPLLLTSLTSTFFIFIYFLLLVKQLFQENDEYFVMNYKLL